MLQLCELMTKAETEKFHDLTGDEFLAHREAMKTKYYERYYGKVDSLPPEIRHLIKSLVNETKTVTSCLLEYGDAHIGDVHKLEHLASRTKDLLNHDL